MEGGSGLSCIIYGTDTNYQEQRSYGKCDHKHTWIHISTELTEWYWIELNILGINKIKKRSAFEPRQVEL